MTIRVDDSIKSDAENLFDKLGMSVSGAINIFFRQAIREQGLPFKPMILKENTNDFITPQRQARQAFKQAFKLAQEQSVINGTDKMTMAEIDSEIATYRKEKRVKK